MKDKLLEVGDEIYSIRGMGREYISIEGKIDRVTKTQAVMGSTKFKREMQSFCGSDTVHKIGGCDRWSSVSYLLLTDEIREEKKKQDIRFAREDILNNWAGNSSRRSISELHDSKLKRIAEILKEPDPKEE